MKFKDLECVRVIDDHPDKNVWAGDKGTIVFVFTFPNEAYEVEFVNPDGSTRAIFALLPEELDKCEEQPPSC